MRERETERERERGESEQRYEMKRKREWESKNIDPSPSKSVGSCVNTGLHHSYCHTTYNHSLHVRKCQIRNFRYSAFSFRKHSDTHTHSLIHSQTYTCTQTHSLFTYVVTYLHAGPFNYTQQHMCAYKTKQRYSISGPNKPHQWRPSVRTLWFPTSTKTPHNNCKQSE